MEEQKTLPAWFHRINALYQERKPGLIQPEEYDEDLSSLSSWQESDDEDEEDWTEEEKELASALLAEEDEAKQEELYSRLNKLQIARETESGAAGVAEADFDDDDEDDEDWKDTTSEQSYDGPDAFGYYVFKDERLDRKKQLLMDPILEAEGRAFETKFIDEVKAAKPAPLARKLAGQGFYLYSTDDLEHYGLNLHAPSILDFEQGKADTNVHGTLVIEPSRAHSVEEFSAPQQDSVGEIVTVKTIFQADSKGSHEITIEFISDDYVKVKAPREFSFETEWEEEDLEPRPEPGPKAPQYFEYFGIHRDIVRKRGDGERSEDMAEEIWHRAVASIKEALAKKKEEKGSRCR